MSRDGLRILTDVNFLLLIFFKHCVLSAKRYNEFKFCGIFVDLLFIFCFSLSDCCCFVLFLFI